MYVSNSGDLDRNGCTITRASSLKADSDGKPPTVLTFVGHYLPGFKAGGPIRSVSNLVERLGDEFDFRIVAADRDLGDAAPYPGIIVNDWNRLGKARVFYRSPGLAGWRALLKSLRSVEFDLIYLNSAFSVSSSLIPLAYRRLGQLVGRPVLLAPRGEFSIGALGLKRTKKLVFLAFARIVGMYRGVTFQASSDFEAADILRTLGAVRLTPGPPLSPKLVAIASDMAGFTPGTPVGPVDSRQPHEAVRAVFLSRISPMKNLAGAIDILARVSVPVEFSIHGIIEDAEFWERCQQRIALLPANVTASYLGEVMPHRVQEVLAAHDFFLFPTLGENYGHVIREALSAGLPVLVSDQTPWRKLEALNAGADLPLDDPDAFARWIEDYHAKDAVERNAMRVAARGLGDNPVTFANDLKANRAMLHAAMSV